MSEENKVKKTGLKPDMNSGRSITEREDAHIGTKGDDARKNRSQKDEDEKDKKAGKSRRAKMNDRKGKFKTERARSTGEPSAIPGAEEEGDIGDAASGAGMGGNKGRGTRSRDKQ